MYNCLLFLLCIAISSLAAAEVFLVPAEPIQKDQIVNDSDFLYDNHPDKKSKGFLLESDAYDLFHQDKTSVIKARKALKAGEFIRKQDLVKLVLKVKIGQKILVKFVKNNLEIEVPMTALSAGKVGDTIKLQNPTGKIVLGEISNEGLVLIK